MHIDFPWKICRKGDSVSIPLLEKSARNGSDAEDLFEDIKSPARLRINRHCDIKVSISFFRFKYGSILLLTKRPCFLSMHQVNREETSQVINCMLPNPFDILFVRDKYLFHRVQVIVSLLTFRLCRIRTKHRMWGRLADITVQQGRFRLALVTHGILFILHFMLPLMRRIINPDVFVWNSNG